MPAPCDASAPGSSAGSSALQIVALPFELAGILPPQYPTWYALFRALVAAAQLAISLWMIRIYRHCGVRGIGR